MRAVGLRVRGILRRRWVSVLVTALVVGIVTGAVLTLAAGARRTAGAPDAFTAAVGGDIGGIIEQPSGTPRTDEVAALPSVESVTGSTFLFAGVLDPETGPEEGVISFAGDPLYGSRLVAGRTTDPDEPHEFVATEEFVGAHDAQLGDHFSILSFTQEQVASGEGFGADPQGPGFEAELVGIVAAADKLETEYTSIVFSPALLDEDIGTSATIMGVRLHPGVTRQEFRAELDTLSDGASLQLDPGRVVSSDVRNAVDAQAQGIWIMAAVAGLASVVALGQLLTRHVRVAASERDPLTALGYSSTQMMTENLARTAVPLVSGTLLGLGIATAASRWFPTGFVRSLEPDPGIEFDTTMLLGVGALLVLAVFAWVAAAIAFAARRVRRAVARPAVMLGARAPSATAATGTRFALSNADGSSTRPIGTFVAFGLIIAALVGATSFAVSLDELVSEGTRFGSNYSFGIGENLGLSTDELRAALGDDEDIARMMLLASSTARAGGSTVGIVGIESVKGGLEPRILAGRMPASADEVALGKVTARELDLGIGDELELSGAAGTGAYQIVGTVVVPTIGGNDGVGLGAVMTDTGFRHVEVEPETVLAAITLRADAPTGARERVAEQFGGEAGLQDRPSSILNVSRVRRIPGLLAVLLGGLAVLTLVHALVVSIQSRRHDLAVLRALGADRGWVARAVHWQATVTTVLPLVLGVPLGLILGSFVFRAFVDRLGALPDPALPILLVVGLMLALVAIANVAAIVPARRARRLSTARLLREE